MKQCPDCKAVLGIPGECVYCYMQVHHRSLHVWRRIMEGVSVIAIGSIVCHQLHCSIIQSAILGIASGFIAARVIIE